MVKLGNFIEYVAQIIINVLELKNDKQERFQNIVIWW